MSAAEKPKIKPNVEWWAGLFADKGLYYDRKKDNQGRDFLDVYKVANNTGYYMTLFINDDESLTLDRITGRVNAKDFSLDVEPIRHLAPKHLHDFRVVVDEQYEFYALK
jgi:hypothetical protein